MAASAHDAPPAGHPFRFSTLAHAGCEILGPMLPAELEAIIDDVLGALDVPPPITALDIGCGKGDLLMRFARRGAHGMGLDRNPWFIAAAAARVAREGVGPLVALRTADAATEPLRNGLDVVACVGATGAIGGSVGAPQAIARLLRPGGIAIIGEGFWRTPPPIEEAEEFGIGPDEIVDLDATVARVAAGGLEPRHVHVASQTGWDAYENEYAAAIERWAAVNGDDPDRAVFLETAAMMRATWGSWRRAAMGFAVVLARRPTR